MVGFFVLLLIVEVVVLASKKDSYSFPFWFIYPLFPIDTKIIGKSVGRLLGAYVA